MSNTELDRAALHPLLTDIILGPDLGRASFGGPARGATAPRWQRVVVRPVELRGERRLQFSHFDGRQDITRNCDPAESLAALEEILAVGFANVHLTTHAEDIDIRTSKKGKVFISRKPTAPSAPAVLAHNRVKDVPLPEGRSNRLLEVMGILTRAGQVRPTMRAKYTQINEFLKQLSHVLDDAGLATLGRPVEILDCGCGASYLTLAVHHYLNEVRGIAARLIGVDVNEDLIRKSIERSERLGAARLQFSCERIDAAAVRPDVVLALHACDTATDDALALAITAQARLILSVPCCHHHLNGRLRAEALRPLLRHGILEQRTADLVTDAFRALILRILGYRTDVVEFISTEHTARNLMIRAVGGLPVGEAGFVREYRALKEFWGVTPYLETVLGEAAGGFV
ncbi:MAG: SAM-dependent methyltransferase [Planctomycetia bacterium]|nr:SAM-dependent methyltransferase [Planctomycetia bacterium]